jgi:uncharacterized cupredoxin-like copper-binding protein
MSNKKLLLATTLLTLVLTSLATACQDQAKAAPLNVVTFVATDYAFAGPGTIPAGWTHLRLENQGPDYHHIQLVKLPADKSVEDLVAALQDSPIMPSWAEHYGGPNPPEAGAISEAIVRLEPGSYALICTVPDKEGRSHVQHGMVKALAVSRPADGTSVEPQADVTLDMFDFGFTLSQPLAAGRHIIRAVNSGEQPHEVFLAHLAPGKELGDFLASFAPDAPPEAHDWQAAGGISVIEPGDHGYFFVDLAPGRYLLICFAPDHHSGAPHFIAGMAEVVTVD